MFARVSTAHGRAEETEQVLAVWRQQILPAAQEQQGFRGVLVLSDRSSGKWYTLTLWDSQADAGRTMTSDYMRQALAQVGPYLTQPVTQEHLEVLLRFDAEQ